MGLELFLIILGLICVYHFRKTKNLPRGPFSVPILGILVMFQVPTRNLGFEFKG